nr:hypothetical protein [Tanacetum cinerariifolium]
MSSSPVPTDTRSIPLAGRARGSPVPTLFLDDPYMLPALSLSLSDRVTEAVTLSPSLFRQRYKSSYETPTSSSSSPALSPTLPSRKRYQGTSKLIADTETECDESKAEGTDSETREATSEDQQ